MDLLKYPVVLGTGPSAIATIYGLLTKCEKVCVIDACIGPDNHLLDAISKEPNRRSSPKFRNPENAYVYKSFDYKYQIFSENFNATSSLAKGGLSNIWGGGFFPYSREEIKDFSYSWKEVKKVYEEIFRVLKNEEIPSQLIMSLEADFKSNDRSYYTEPFKTLVATNPSHVLPEPCHLLSCQTGCINCNRGIFNSGIELEKLIKLNKVHYIPHTFIDKIERRKDLYEIKCVDTRNDRKDILLANTIFCCLGVLATSKIVLQMVDPNATLPLLSTPAGQFIALEYGKRDKEVTTSIMSGKTIVLDQGDRAVANLFPLTENLLAVMIGNTPARLVLDALGKQAISRLIIGNIYFSSRYSNNVMWLEKDELHIKGELPDKLIGKFKNSLKELNTKLKREGFIKIPFAHKLLQPGQDIHYGGTLPMKDIPSTLQCDSKGRLHGVPNFYISDASSLAYMHAKPHTFNAMVQSFLIGKGW